MQRINSLNSYSFWVFGSIILIQLVSAMVNIGITPLLPFIKEDLKLNIVEIGYLAAAVQLGNGLSSLPSGYFVDIFGSKKILFLGGFSLGLASISLYWMDNYFLILLFLFISGLFFSSLSPAMSKAIIQLFPARIRGTVMGIKQTAISLSAFIAALWLPYIAIKHGWRMGYLIIGILAVLMSLTALFYKNSLDESKGRRQNKSSLKNVIIILKNDSVRTVCYVIPFFFIAQFVPASYLMVDVNERFEIPMVQAGYLLAFLQFGSILGRIIFGMLGDWLFLQKRELLLAIIALLTSVFLFIFAFIAVKGFLILGIVVFFIGFTGSGWNSIFLVYVSEIMDAGYIGLTSGLTLSIGYLAATIAIPVFGALTELFDGFVIPWLFLAVCMLISSTAFYRLNLRNHKNMHFTDGHL
jgi:sugar phosphate permease